MLQKFLGLDKQLLLLINQRGKNAFFDAIMPFLREPKFWAPLYLFTILFVCINFTKNAFYWVVGALVTVALNDIISSKCIKPLFARHRPCLDAEFATQVRLLANYCGANGSFTSSHAANHFGLAMFFFITLRHIWPKAIYLYFGWAAAICYAQIYVGVHYPTDILGGAILGCLLGFFTGNFYNKKFGQLA